MPDGSRRSAVTQEFRPGPGSERAYRDALGAFATGVTIVTCRDDQWPLAITANSFASISLDPPLVMWSPAVSSSRHDSFVAAPRFAIHVLAADQLTLGRRFALDGRAFDGTDWEEGDGLPMLPCLARFDCRHHAAHGAGDHTIVLGQVERVVQGEGAPLVFCQGAYGRFANED